MQFVFCISFLCSLIPLKKSSLECFNKFVAIFIISNIREVKDVNAQNYVFFNFGSDIIKIFPSDKPVVEIKGTRIKLGLATDMCGRSSF